MHLIEKINIEGSKKLKRVDLTPDGIQLIVDLFEALTGESYESFLQQMFESSKTDKLS